LDKERLAVSSQFITTKTLLNCVPRLENIDFYAPPIREEMATLGQ